MSHKRLLEKQIRELKETISIIKLEIESLSNELTAQTVYDELIEFRIKLDQLEKEYNSVKW